MKTTIYLISYFSLILMLTACPYESDIALSNSDNSIIDSTILGSWQAAESIWDKDTIKIEIVNFNDHEYFIEYREVRKSGNVDISFLRSFTSYISDKKILNVNEIGKPNKVSYYKYELKNKKLIFAYVSYDFIRREFKSQKEMNDFFRKNINKKGFFEEEIVFNKM